MGLLLSTFLYRIAIWGYHNLLAAVASFNAKAKLFTEGRKELLQHIQRTLHGDTAPKIWFHCASMGEFEQARPVMEALRKKYQQHRIVVTFFSPSGYESRKNTRHADYIFYLPADTPENARKLVTVINPGAVFFTRYDLWYYMLLEVKKKGVPLYLLSANFTAAYAGFQWYGKLFRHMLRLFDIIFTQNEETALLLKGIRVPQVIVSRDTRFDTVIQLTKEAKSLPLVEQFKGNKLLLVAGSSYVAEETMIHEAFPMPAGVKVIIAPHDIDEAHIKTIVEQFSDRNVLLYSDATDSNVQDAEVLVINNIGLLSSIYRYADIAFIGGGYGHKGLHNTLEAATYGMPILFGPNNHEKFPEAGQLIEHGIAEVVKDQKGFETIMNTLSGDEKKRRKMAENSRQFVKEQAGATEVVMSNIRLAQGKHPSTPLRLRSG